MPRDIPKEPIRRRRKSASTVEEPWPLPAVVVAYHITYDGHPDSYPLHIVSKVLSDGQSSRIYRKLVYETGLALTAFGGGNIIEHPNLFFAVGIVNPGQSPAAVEKALIAELERLKTEGITERELQRAKNQFARDYILGRESLQDKATHLAHAEVIHSDITTADGEFDIFQKISLADVQRVAKTYFTPERAGGPARDAEGRRADDRASIARSLLAATALLSRRASSRGASRASRRRKPGSGRARGRRGRCAARPVKFPPYEISKLPNGLQVVLVSHHEQPAVSVRMIVRAGAAQDPKGKIGLAMLTALAPRSGRGQAHGGTDCRRDRLRRRHSRHRRRHRSHLRQHRRDEGQPARSACS